MMQTYKKPMFELVGTEFNKYDGTTTKVLGEFENHFEALTLMYENHDIAWDRFDIVTYWKVIPVQKTLTDPQLELLK